MKRILRHALERSSVPAALAVLALVASQAGCSSDGPPASSTSPGAPGLHAPAGDITVDSVTGSVKVTLKFPSGFKTFSGTFWITGPGGALTVLTTGSLSVSVSSSSVSVSESTSGSVSLGTSSSSSGGSVSVVLTFGNIPAGAWTFVLSSNPDAGTPCGASAPFTIPSTGGSTSITLPLTCGAPDAGAGWAAVGANLTECGTANYVTAVPMNVKVGQSLQLTGSGSAPNPSAITYQWSAPSGTFGTPTATSTSFTCTAAGPVTVTFTVGDGPTATSTSCSSSPSTTTAQITCD